MIDIRTIDEPPADVCARLAELYNLRQYSDSAGRVNPNDPRYVTGGVHFSRTGEWFAEQLARQGAMLLAAIRDGELVGYSMFFTELDHFPSFGDDVRWMAEVEGVNGQLGYSYLTTVHPDFCEEGIAWRLVSERRDLCRELGLNAVATEVFCRPIANVPSIRLHHKQCEAFGAVDTGQNGTHELVIPAAGDKPERTTTITYMQFLIPCHDNVQAVVNPATGRPWLIPSV